uniref:Uncharacterized protein n=1 Tax=Klebsiella pneumoniae TaxID=573 RepID=A0A2P1BPI6_KLEPN|nr:hypothetical protein [Klebsiella pneumoniae]
MLTSRHRLGYLCKNNKYDQAKYFLDIYSDSAEMSGEKAFLCICCLLQMNPMMSSFTGQNHLIVRVGAGIKRGA